MKHCCIISPFSTAPTHLELPQPALSSSASHSTPAPYFPGLTTPSPQRGGEGRRLYGGVQTSYPWYSVLCIPGPASFPSTSYTTPAHYSPWLTQVLYIIFVL